MYTIYYVLSSAYIASIDALKGKLNDSLNFIKTTEKLMQNRAYAESLDEFSLKQIEHIFALIRFYVYTRVYKYDLEFLQDLKKTILEGINKYYSNQIMLSEFLLDAKLTPKQLLKLTKMDNMSVQRVQHIIDFLLKQTQLDPEEASEQRVKKCIQLLQKRPNQEKELLVEQAFVDLLIAKQWFKIERYDKIIELLEPYRAHWEELEVEELNIYIYGLLQYASYKEGDPLAAALQYRAIRACQELGFTRLGHFLIEKFEEIKQEALSKKSS